MHDFIKKLEDLQQQAVSQLKAKKKPEELRYIGQKILNIDFYIKIT